MSSPQIPKPFSPIRAKARPQNPQKERRRPSITPRRFRKFFDNKAAALPMSSPSGRALKELVNDRQGIQSSPLKPFKDPELQGQENEELISTPREFKRRKTKQNDTSSDDDCLFKDPTNSQNEQPSRSLINIAPSYSKSLPTLGELEGGEDDEDAIALSLPKEPKDRIGSFENQGLSARLLQFSLGTSRSRRANLALPVNGNLATVTYRYTYLLMCIQTGEMRLHPSILGLKI